MHIKTNKSDINHSLYIFTVEFFWFTSDFSIHLKHFISELQTSSVSMRFLNQERDENFWCKHFLGLLKFFDSAFSAPPFSVREILHVAYKKYKIKRKFTFVR